VLILNAINNITSLLKSILLSLVRPVWLHVQYNSRFLLPQISCLKPLVLFQFRTNFKTVDPVGILVEFLGRRIYGTDQHCTERRRIRPQLKNKWLCYICTQIIDIIWSTKNALFKQQALIKKSFTNETPKEWTEEYYFWDDNKRYTSS
jgi:hypothetical protein